MHLVGTIFISLVLLISIALLALTISRNNERKNPTTLSKLHSAFPVDLKRYQGQWKEVARLNNEFQKDCVGCVTATYTLDADGVSVLNQCRLKNGATSKGFGKAWSNNAENTWLSVSFLPWAVWPFSLAAGDYLIHYVDKEYKTAIVGNQRYMWILARDSIDISGADYLSLVERAKALGYDTDQLKVTPTCEQVSAGCCN